MDLKLNILLCFLTTTFILCHGRYINKYLYQVKPRFYKGNSVVSDGDHKYKSGYSYNHFGSSIRNMFSNEECKGNYNKGVINKLDELCDSCYNLYRKPMVARKCREKCYNNKMFNNCIYDLMLHDYADEYASLVRYIG